MRDDSGQTRTLWQTATGGFDRAPLTADESADICIVGAGIAGISVAWHLVQAGRSVIVVDDGPIGGGETGRTTAHLANEIDDRLYEIERVHGLGGARLTVQSHGAAIDRIEAIVNELAIDCDFQRLDGYLFAGTERPTVSDSIRRELETAHRIGWKEVEKLPRIPGVKFDSGPCLRFPGQAQFHPLRYMDALARAVESRGGRIYTGSHVAKFEAHPERPSVKTTSGHTVTASAIVFATNSPVNDWVKMHTKQAPYRTYVVAYRILRGSVPRALYWDDQEYYHYVRVHEGTDLHDVLVVGGEDHKTGQNDDYVAPFMRLDEWTREHFPMAGEVLNRWSGQVLEPVDHLGFIGRNPGGDGNVYIATGDSGQGMTHGTIAGMLIADLILGRANEWETLYDPARISLRTAGEFARENLNVAVQYADFVKPGEVDSADDVAPGTGAVIRRGARRIAVYRDDSGNVHERSAICTHLYCIVDWNDVEKSWDCPCHGSRFDPLGTVINGPAIAPLAKPDAD
jgi:glycine/D-amino acid oxidase-like deaminating enzyme/nitrite reductase/ring-hydroxylating ferredoxin subunit